jgi:hypothetical protein
VAADRFSSDDDMQVFDNFFICSSQTLLLARTCRCLRLMLINAATERLIPDKDSWTNINSSLGMVQTTVKSGFSVVTTAGSGRLGTTVGRLKEDGTLDG